MKNEPLISKNDVLNVIQSALMGQVQKVIEGYSSPLDKIIRDVITENEEALSKVIRDALTMSFKDKQFVSNVNTEFKHKVAKVLVGKLEGAVEKAAEKLRADPTIRARLILAIEELIK